MQGDGFATELGGILEEAMRLCTPCGSSTQLCCVGFENIVLVLGNEGGGPHHMQRSSYKGPKDWFKEASGFDFEYSSNIQLRLSFLLLYTYFKPKG